MPHLNYRPFTTSFLTKLKSLAAMASAFVSGWVFFACNLSGSNGIDGTTSLIQTTAEEKSSHCKYGGVRIDVGADVNFDGVLSEFEITSIQYICNGAHGATGTAGVQGEAGISSLTQTSAIPPGLDKNNGGCEAGGVRIDSGKDSNGNNLLDELEIASTKYICNGLPGESGVSSIASVVPVSEGETCASGGVQVQFGTDVNSNGALESTEIQSTQYLCNGIQGEPGEHGLNALTTTIMENPGENCPFGGIRLGYGVDLNQNNQLDLGEIDKTEYVCHGENGADALCTGVTPPEVTVSPGEGTGRLLGNTYYLTVTSTKSGMTHDIIGAPAKFTLHQTEQEKNGKYVTTWKYSSETKMSWTSFAVISKDECSSVVNSFGLTFIDEDIPLVTIPERVGTGTISAVPSFKIMKYPVSVSLMSECLESKVCPVTERMYGTSLANRCNINPPIHHIPSGDYIFNCVNYEGAVAFCNWLGGRLPTYNEWMTAARHNGTTYVATQKYPWGNTFPDHCFHANYVEYDLSGNELYCNHSQETSTIQSPGYIYGFSPGYSALGVATMVGDASEWVERPIPLGTPIGQALDYFKKAYLCGGSFEQEADALQLDNTCVVNVKTLMGSDTSIRCAFDL